MGKPFFSRKGKEQKPTEEKEKNKKKDRAYQKNRMRKLIWAVLIVFVLASIQSIFLSRNALGRLQKTNQQVSILEKKLNKLESEQSLDAPSTNAFLKDFITTYYSVTDDRDKEMKRREKLADYYAPLNYQTGSLPSTQLEVKAIENYGYQQDGDLTIGRFFVETQTTQDKPQTFQSVVNVKFKQTSKGYQICSLPYQQSDTRNTYIEKNPKTPLESRNDLLQDQAGRERIESFIKQFLKEYEQNNQDNLRYLMKDVEGLPDNVSVKIKDLKVYGTTEKPTVNCTLTLTYKETGIEFQEGLELHLTKNAEGKYYIEQMNHY